jgi:hypothetical protein
VDFGAAEFSGSEVDFSRAEFSGGEVNLSGAEFFGGKVDFKAAGFSGGEVDLQEPDSYSAPPLFDTWATTPPGLLLPSPPTIPPPAGSTATASL